MTIIWNKLLILTSILVIYASFNRAFNSRIVTRTRGNMLEFSSRTRALPIIQSDSHLHPYRRGIQKLFTINSERSFFSPVSSRRRNLTDFVYTQSHPQFLFVGGKGGVGKTSSSSAISVACSNAGRKTLVVSTDPAHSLGDALGINLSNGTVKKVQSEFNLYALEIDVKKAMSEFQDMAKGLDTQNLAKSLNIPKDIIDSIGLEELTNIFKNPPPGIDEIIALTTILKYAEDKLSDGSPRFDRIVIDTAPTGHTLRLLQLPQFLDSVVGRVIRFRAQLSSAIQSFQSMFGAKNSPPKPNEFMETLSKLESVKDNLAKLKRTLEDSDSTQFAVVTIPTALAVAETERLITSLKKQNVAISTIICNQILSPDFGRIYINNRRLHQRRYADIMVEEAANIDSSIEIVEAPYVNTNMTGVLGLRYFSTLAHPETKLRSCNPINSTKLAIFGGKGGVGKTSSAASWAVKLSDAGFRTLVVSTDPAHSLGDAFEEKLNGIPRILDRTVEGGELWAMEIDPEKAMIQFRDSLKSATESKSSGFMGGFGIGKLKDEVIELLSGVNDPPPGADEIIALMQVVNFLEYGYNQENGKKVKFDRIVLDTAPTGHTLRMLELPIFIVNLLRKLQSLRQKADILGNMMERLAGKASPVEIDEEGELVRLERQMLSLNDILRNKKRTEFTVVTIPTELAILESRRLLASLKESKVPVRRVIINQMIPYSKDGSVTDSYLDQLRQGQQASLEKLSQIASEINVDMVKVPYFDVDVNSSMERIEALGEVIAPEPK